MSTHSGFTLTEVLISLLVLCLSGLGALSASLVARQQVMIATQQTIALSLTTELVGRMASHDSSDGYYEGIHPLWTTAAATECTESYLCDAKELSQFHLYSTLSASGHSRTLQLLQQPALCVRQQANEKIVQLSWRSPVKVHLQRPASLCDLAPHRLQISAVVP
jgi:prepilin-type N-terminal cleavage/methylation domain-containing protein